MNDHFENLSVSTSDLEPLPRVFRMRSELKVVRNESGMGRQAHATSAQLANLAITATCGALWSPNVHVWPLS